MSKKDTGGPSMEQLLKRMEALEAESARLKIAVDEKDKKILELEAKTEAAGEATITMLGHMVTERYLGKRKVPVKTYDHKKKEYVSSEREIDMYEYFVNLAPIQGEAVHINNIPFIHNSTVEVDLNTLASLKDTIARGWWHEAQITDATHQEAKFRRPTRPIVLSGKTGARVA
jgi:hypothetical protein